MYMSEFSTNKRLYENISKMKLMLRLYIVAYTFVPYC